jgi:hypothetical protein
MTINDSASVNGLSKALALVPEIKSAHEEAERCQRTSHTNALAAAIWYVGNPLKSGQIRSPGYSDLLPKGIYFKLSSPNLSGLRGLRGLSGSKL